MAIQHQFVSSPTIRVNGQEYANQLPKTAVAVAVKSAVQMWNAGV